MVFRNRILSLTVVLALGAVSALASSPQASKATASAAAPKNKAQPKSKDHVVKGSVIVSTDDSLTVRSGKKDMSFKLDSSTQKPASMAPGTEISITYRDEGQQHVASAIELSAAKSFAAKPSSRK